MSEFKCEVVRVEIIPHPNADAIEIAKVGDYQSIVKKGQFCNGELAVYLPEQAIIPKWLLVEMGFWDEERQKGGLHGATGNRIKAIKLRGVLSQGIVYGGEQFVEDEEVEVLLTTGRDVLGLPYGVGLKEGDDAAEFLGVVKYEPAIPAHMAGRIIGADLSATHKYDFDNLKKMPSMFDDGEHVVITEKIHGTFLAIGVVPTKDANEKYYGGRVTISSKGMGAKGFVLDHNDEGNLYAQCAKKHGLLDKVLEMGGLLADSHDKPVFLCGEVFGRTMGGGIVQDLTYTDEPLDFRAFDICVGNRGSEEYFDWMSFSVACEMMGIYRVPALFIGPYSKRSS